METALQDTSRPFQLSGTAILAGTATCLSLIVLLGLFCAGVGLVGDEFSLALFVPLLVLIVVIPFFAAGWLTVLSTAGRNSYLHALTVWGIVTVALTLLVGSQVSALAGGALKQLGMGAGVNIQMNALIDQLADLRPTFVTQVHLKEGTAVTQLVFSRRPGSMTQETAQAAREEARSARSGTTSGATARDAISEVQPEVRKAAAATTWSAFASLIVALASILIGARLARHRTSTVR